MPFATMGLPLVTMAALGLLWPEPIGQSLQALYLTWSPYHYAAQSYGLAVMYAYRSGGLAEGQKSLLWLTERSGSERRLAHAAGPQPALIGPVTVFHGIQYLAILTAFHARERRRLDPEGPSGLVHGLRFYVVCLGLGYLLFQVWPWAGVLVGFSYAESVIVSAAVVNIHHFRVDGYIWRLRGDRNYATVSDASPVAA